MDRNLKIAVIIGVACILGVLYFVYQNDKSAQKIQEEMVQPNPISSKGTLPVLAPEPTDVPPLEVSGALAPEPSNIPVINENEALAPEPADIPPVD